MNQTEKKIRGFTLLEILLVVAAIAILAGIVIVAINPAKQLAETRDAQRHSDVNAISSAIAQYLIKTGQPPAIEGGSVCGDATFDSVHGICATGASCGGVSLDIDNALVPDYIPAVPSDPSITNENFSGYTAFLLGNGRILICAPFTEQADETISVTR